LAEAGGPAIGTGGVSHCLDHYRRVRGVEACQRISEIDGMMVTCGERHS
jgi:hypothetical protein